MKRAVLYARVSSDDSGKDYRNLSGQLDECRKYAEDRGWEVVGEHSEEISGAREDRPELDQIRTLAQRGMFDFLIVREPDRLARDVYIKKKLFREFQNSGVVIEFVLRTYDRNPDGSLTDDAEMMSDIEGAVDERERKRIRTRTMRGRRLSVKQGNIIVHGRPPYGFDFVKVDINGVAGTDGAKFGRLMIDEKTAEPVKRIFQMYAAGHTIKEIAGALEGTPTPSEVREYPGLVNKHKPPGVWSSSTINRILDNETYAGRFVYKGWELPEPVVVKVPPIVDAATWDAVRRRREQNRQVNASRAAKYDYLLAGRGRCGQCGLAIHSLPIRNRPGAKIRLYYRCPSHDKAKHGRDCDLPYFNATVADAAVWNAVKRYLTEPDQLEAGMTVYLEKQAHEGEPIRRRLEIVESLIADETAKLSRLLDLYLAGSFERTVLEDKKQLSENLLSKFRSERDDLREKLEGQLTADELRTLQGVITAFGEKLREHGDQFEFRRYVLNRLSVMVTFALEEGERVLYLSGEIGEIGRVSLDHGDKSAWTEMQPSIRFTARILPDRQIGDDLACEFFVFAGAETAALL